jgi:hypothetical protein
MQKGRHLAARPKGRTTRLFGRAVPLALAFVLATAAVALADQFQSDNDTLVPSAQTGALNLTLTPGATVTRSVGALVNSQGQSVTFPVEVHDISILNQTGTPLSNLSAASGTITGYGGANQLSVDVDVSAPEERDLVCGVTNEFTGRVVFDASGTQRLNPDSVQVQINVSVAGPPCETVDTTSPTIIITTPSDGAVYVLNQMVLADYECEDEADGSGLASCIGEVPDGDAVDTSAVGSKTFTVNAEDNAGNGTSKTHHYTVKYGICLLYDHTKAHQANSTVPIKVFLCDADGNNVSDPGIVVQAKSLGKQDSVTVGAPEASGYANPDDNFRYDAALDGGNGGYIFNLSTKSPSPALGQQGKLGSGTWKLSFEVGGVAGYSVTFDVR